MTELLTVDEVAKALKVSPGSVRRYIASGRLAAVKVGRAIRVRPAAVDDFLEPVAPGDLEVNGAGLVGADDEDQTPVRGGLWLFTGFPELPPYESDEELIEGEPLTEGDALWQLIGAFDSGPEAPTDVSQDKYKYLAEAYGDLHEE